MNTHTHTHTHTPRAATRTPMARSPHGLHDTGAARASLVLAGLVLGVFGLLYSLAAAGLGGAVFPYQAGGSLIQREGRVVGALHLAQPFADARYFHPRPSAAGHDPMAAAGSNQARSNPELHARIAVLTAEVAAREGIAPAQVPAELVTQSGGGLDPHVSPAGARVQVARVARARGMSAAEVERIVADHIEPAHFGLLGQPRVTVLALNVALDARDRRR